MTLSTGVFDLPDRLAAKRDATLITEDERRFGAISRSLERSIAELDERLAAQRRSPGSSGQAALERDLEIHRLTARLAALRRFGPDLCLGRIVGVDGDASYIGRLGLTDASGGRLLVDWRSPAAEPFFGATRATPMGLVSRRRYRWTRGRISDYWDESFALDGGDRSAALDDESAFIESLGESRSTRMRDVLGTIQADQDAIIRAGSHGALVVDGGPGTGKTVVALHRAAYLLYADQRVRRGGVLVVGPHRGYLAFVDDVLPSLGEDGVHTCTLRDLVPEGATAGPEGDPEVALLKSSARLVGAVEAAVALYERPPATGATVETPWADVWLSAEEWAEAFNAADAGTSHNDAREDVWGELLVILADRFDGAVPVEVLGRALREGDLREQFERAWPLLDPVGVVAGLWAASDHLARCAPWLEPHEIAALRRDEPRAWTVSDLPFLDAARQRVGDPGAARRRQQAAAALATQREQMDQVIDDLIDAEVLDDGEGLMTMLRGQDLRNSLVDETGVSVSSPDLLAGPFAHIVVDEAQELTDAEWQMLLRRCPSRSFTVAGDRAQARHGFGESWQQRLGSAGLTSIEVASLGVNYRTPREVMAEAEPVIRAMVPDANVPSSIRSSGVPVVRGAASDLRRVLDDWLAAHAEGTACVIGDAAFPAEPRVRSLTPELSKGLEFDLVVLVDPEAFGDGVQGAVDRYVAMTRSTRELVILTTNLTSGGSR